MTLRIQKLVELVELVALLKINLSNEGDASIGTTSASLEKKWITRNAKGRNVKILILDEMVFVDEL
jgi:hypothetical protein